MALFNPFSICDNADIVQKTPVITDKCSIRVHEKILKVHYKSDYEYTSRDMVKIVINASYGGFGLSNEAIRKYLQLKEVIFSETLNEYGSLCFYVNDKLFIDDNIERTDPFLIETIEQLERDGINPNTSSSKLFIDFVEKGTKYRIIDYDGSERIEKENQIEWLIA